MIIGPAERARFARFALVGFSGALVDMGILFALHAGLHVALTLAKIVSFECATANNFWFNDRWTFADRAEGGTLARLRRFSTYNAVCAGGLILSVLLLNAQVRLLHVNAYLANVLTIGVVTGWNYLMNGRFTWARAARTAPTVQRSRAA
jgi:dolichol-phosphate mannosyltransferase